MPGILTLGIFSTLCACARPCDLLLSLGKLAVSLDLLLFLILPGLSMHLGHTLFRWYLLVLSRGIRLDFVIACQVSSWNFVVMHGNAQREQPTSFIRVLSGVCVTEAKFHGREAVLSFSSVKRFMGSEPEGHGYSPVVTSWALLHYCPWTGAGEGIAACCKAGGWFLGSARGVLMFNLILSHPWEAVSTPEC